jgi:hypothetical protein
MSSSKVPGPGVEQKTEYEELVVGASVAAVEKESGLETVVWVGVDVESKRGLWHVSTATN